MPSVSDLLGGVVVESRTKSWTGDHLIYSDKTYNDGVPGFTAMHFQPLLNEFARIYVIGIAAGVTRMALSTIHTVGHLFAGVVTFDKGHLWHAAKGGCEFSRGFIESIPIAGRIFAIKYYDSGLWWIIKIYNPDAPDSLDRHTHTGCWSPSLEDYTNCWSQFKKSRPSAYIIA